MDVKLSATLSGHFTPCEIFPGIFAPAGRSTQELGLTEG
jgi:hypothetical protein